VSAAARERHDMVKRPFVSVGFLAAQVTSIAVALHYLVKAYVYGLGVQLLRASSPSVIGLTPTPKD
jgi:hypothetical protein